MKQELHNMNEIQIEQYMSFMYNSNNEYNCEECPENRGFSSWGGNKPCGQQNCWVTCHCRERD